MLAAQSFTDGGLVAGSTRRTMGFITSPYGFQIQPRPRVRLRRPWLCCGTPLGYGGSIISSCHGVPSATLGSVVEPRWGTGRLAVTPKALHSKAQSRAAHPGDTEVEEARSEAEILPLTRPAADLSPRGEVEKTRAPGQSLARPTRDRPRPNEERAWVRGTCGGAARSLDSSGGAHRRQGVAAAVRRAICFIISRWEIPIQQ